jgi:hypothetical protein
MIFSKLGMKLVLHKSENIAQTFFLPVSANLWKNTNLCKKANVKNWTQRKACVTAYLKNASTVFPKLVMKLGLNTAEKPKT